MFNHVGIIKQLFVTSDGNRRNLITHTGVISCIRARTLREIVPCECEISSGGNNREIIFRKPVDTYGAIAFVQAVLRISRTLLNRITGGSVLNTNIGTDNNLTLPTWSNIHLTGG